MMTHRAKVCLVAFDFETLDLAALVIENISFVLAVLGFNDLILVHLRKLFFSSSVYVKVSHPNNYNLI